MANMVRQLKNKELIRTNSVTSLNNLSRPHLLGFKKHCFYAKFQAAWCINLNGGGRGLGFITSFSLYCLSCLSLTAVKAVVKDELPRCPLISLVSKFDIGIVSWIQKFGVHLCSQELTKTKQQKTFPQQQNVFVTTFIPSLFLHTNFLQAELCSSYHTHIAYGSLCSVNPWTLTWAQRTVIFWEHVPFVERKF